jgi:predicted secreted protein
MELPDQIELKVGERKVVRLPGLGTSGYSWAHSLSGSDQTVAITLSTAPPPGPGPSPGVGSSSDKLFTIEALKPGQVNLHLTQRRAWETNTSPLKEHAITIVVRP